MATKMLSPSFQTCIELPAPKHLLAPILSYVSKDFNKSLFSCQKRLHSEPSLFQSSRPHFFSNSKSHCCRKMEWSCKSNVNGGGVSSSPPNNSINGTRLIRAIQALGSKLDTKIKELTTYLLMKLLFFLAGFYCSTAFATVIGQTGDWDILAAALAVALAEGIGALMYKASVLSVHKVRDLITMFNYWKAGLSLGLFLDSFKYEMYISISLWNPFNLEIDLFQIF